MSKWLGFCCSKTVPEPPELIRLGLALSEKQIPQRVGKIERTTQRMESLEPSPVRPRQVRYQAALRPDLPPSYGTAPCSSNRRPHSRRKKIGTIWYHRGNSEWHRTRSVAGAP